MRSLLLGVLVLLLAAQVLSAQETFKIQNASREYDVLVQVASCGGAEQNNDPNNCSGAARVSLYRKGAKSPFQVLRLPNVEIYKDTIAYNPKINEKPRGLYEEEYSFVFQDFDFDGRDDLAICNGRNGGYGGPSYNVYLFNNRLRQFVENRRLSKLTEDKYLGLFLIEPKKRRLLAFSKSGCCYHETEVYKVLNGRPILVEKEIEDATGETVVVTTRKLIKGKWVKSVRRGQKEDQ
jgi:hypothetical protein